MKTTLEDIRKNIQNNKYQNKEHIRLSLISRILQKLGWDLWNPFEVYPDFTITLNKELLAKLFDNTTHQYIPKTKSFKFE